MVNSGSQSTESSFATRFHLHPSIRLLKLGKGVVLTLPSGATWRFSADCEVDVAETVYLANANQIRKATQIILASTVGNQDVGVKWALKRATAGEIGHVPQPGSVN